MPVRAAPAAAPAHDRGDPVRQRQRRPRRGAAVPSGSRRSGRFSAAFVSTSSRGDPLERLGVLHERDRQVERRAAARPGRRRASARRARRDIPRQSRGASTPRVRARSRAVVDAERAVEVEVELGLGHRREGRRGATVAVGRRGRSVDRAAMADATIPAAAEATAHVHHPGHRRERLRRQHDLPALLAAGHRVVGAGPHARRRRAARPRPPAARLARPRRDAHRRRHRAGVASGRRRRRRRDPPSRGHPARPQRRRGAAPGQHRGHAQRRGRGAERAGVRRFIHMGALGVVDDPALHYASSKAKAEALVRASGLDWTILKPSLLFGEGDGFFNIIADLVRMSPGRRAGAGRRPAAGSSRSTSATSPASSSRCLERPGDRRRDVRAGRAALLDLPRDHREVLAALGQAAADRPDAGAADLARRRRRPSRPPAVPRRHRPAPPAAVRQHRPARRRPARGSGSSRGRWRAPSGTCARSARDQRTRGDLAGPPRTAVVSGRGGRAPRPSCWLVAVVAIAFGAAGLDGRDAAEPGPARQARADLGRRPGGPPASRRRRGLGRRALGRHRRARRRRPAARSPRSIGRRDRHDGRGDRRAATAASTGPRGGRGDPRRAGGRAVRRDAARRPARLARAPGALRRPSSAWRPRRWPAWTARGPRLRPAATAAASSRPSSPSTTGWSGSPPTRAAHAQVQGGDRDHRLGRRRSLKAAHAARDRLANTVDVSTLDQWLERNETYDAALRALYKLRPEGRQAGHQAAEGGDRRREGRPGAAAARTPGGWS